MAQPVLRPVAPTVAGVTVSSTYPMPQPEPKPAPHPEPAARAMTPARSPQSRPQRAPAGRSTAPQAMALLAEVQLPAIEARVELAGLGNPEGAARDEGIRARLLTELNHDYGLIAPKVVEHHHLVVDPAEAFENLARLLAAEGDSMDVESLEVA